MTEQTTLTIAECDRRLLVMHAAYCLALDDNDLMKADAAYEMLDALLDVRINLPLQRTP
jgi:hypothetical protein